ncbi:hypothetical protein DAPPUDRAFT_346847 [Daphnia pulex]|uniref:Gustatory receptor n=1 Tax=Daphnia pulex TaxID=6669 RepID=E9H9V4_DAPPU|nr:hypothetical protein DAPPUDRAFT_346847 [Daphnia pulex]|eukprot:EFX71465.1 hypothetical protein DAPPUDRAFT_346847 [Daphnia pulex]
MGAMASVRTDESLPRRFPAWAVDEGNKGDPVDTARQIPLVPFQPLIVCLRILGVELDPAILNESSKCYRYLSWSLGLFSLLSNGLCNIFAGVLGQRKNIYEHNKAVLSTYNPSLIDGNNSTISSVMSWNLIIDYVNYGVLAFGVHASLFVITRQQKWKLLWDNVQQQILQHHNEFKEISKSIRRLTIAGLLIVILESLWLASSPLYFMRLDETHQVLVVIFSKSFSYLFHVYAFCGLLVIALIGWTVAQGFRSLHLELKISSLFTTASDIRPALEKEEMIQKMLTDWKGLHVLLCDAVDGINDCLGPVLLIWVAHIFVGFIATPFYIFGGFRSSQTTNTTIIALNLSLMVMLSFHLFVITGIPSRIWHEAIENGKLLQQVNLKDSNHLQEQVNMLTTEVFLSLPRVTAMEYADLDFSLIPTVIGTCLTYLIILCQFQSSEE